MSTDKRLNIFKMSVLHNLIYRVNIIPIKIPASYFEKLILKIIWRDRRPRIANTILMESTKLENWYYPTSRLTIKLQ